MRWFLSFGLLLVVLAAGCSHAPIRTKGGDHHCYVVSFPSIRLKADPLERIEAVDVEMHCGRFLALNHIPDDWSAEVKGPWSEVTNLRMEAGHGSSSLCRSGDLDHFITICDCEPSYFKITATLSVFSYDGELHERKIHFTKADLVMARVPNNSLHSTPR